MEFKDVYHYLIGNKAQYEKSGIMIEYSDDEIQFRSPFGRGTIHFWNEYQVIEQTVYDLNHRMAYHLDYQFESFNQMINLFGDFYSNLMHPKTKKRRIAICCLNKKRAIKIAKEYNELCSLTNEPLIFKAVPFYGIKDDCFMYDFLVFEKKLHYTNKLVNSWTDTPRLFIDIDLNQRSSCLELLHKIKSLLATID